MHFLDTADFMHTCLEEQPIDLLLLYTKKVSVFYVSFVTLNDYYKLMY